MRAAAALALFAFAAGSAHAQTGVSVNLPSGQSAVIPSSTPLTAGVNESCIATSSLSGGSALGISLQAVRAAPDDRCNRRLDADLASRLGDRELAYAILCGNPDVAKAAKTLGRERCGPPK